MLATTTAELANRAAIERTADCFSLDRFCWAIDNSGVLVDASTIL